MRYCRRLALLALMATPLSAGADTSSSAGIPIVLQMDGRIAVSVRINGAGPFRFRLDTGASRTVISSRLVGRLRLVQAGQSRTITHTGHTQRGLVRLERLTLGLEADHAATNLLALVLDPQEIDGEGRVEGLLGQDVLSSWVYTIDYRSRQLFLFDHAPTGKAQAVRLPLSVRSDGLVAAVDLPGASRPLHLVPDTGADRLVLFRAACSALPQMTLLDTVRVRSVTGEAMARLALVNDLSLTGIMLGDHQALILEQRPRDGAMGDGLMPLHLFGRVTFNVAESYLLLEPR
jgi:predicted aspartyl protease